MALSLLRRMRTRVLVAWFAQGAIGLGLVLSILAGAATAGTDWSSVAVMVIALTLSVGVWLRFAFGIPLIVLDVVFGLLGLGLGAADAGGSAPPDLVRRFVSGLWLIGGFAGAVALIASTRAGDDATSDVDTTAY